MLAAQAVSLGDIEVAVAGGHGINEQQPLTSCLACEKGCAWATRASSTP